MPHFNPIISQDIVNCFLHPAKLSIQIKSLNRFFSVIIFSPLSCFKNKLIHLMPVHILFSVQCKKKYVQRHCYLTNILVLAKEIRKLKNFRYIQQLEGMSWDFDPKLSRAGTS